MACELESRELMSLCLKNVNGLNKPSGPNGEKTVLVDAGWIWTEPHSMRLKVRLTVQKQVQTGTILQQSFVVVFIVRNQQCIECQAEFRQGSWKSVVQVRQRVGHKRTFLYLEQLILKHGAHRGSLSIETFRDGMDFYFPDTGKAARFITFLENVVPIKVCVFLANDSSIIMNALLQRQRLTLLISQCKASKKLIGTDDKSNISNYKYTNLVEICPLCKEDLLFLPSRTARNLGNISRLVLVKNITNHIHIIDPLTGQTAQMNPEAFWRDPIRPIITAARSRFVRYIVLGKDAIILERNVSKRSATRRNKSKLASLTVAKEEDLGINDVQIEERSHVGYLMKAGDISVGYDLTDVQFVDDDAEDARAAGKFPDVVMLRKLYGGVATCEADAAKQRVFKLQKLDAEAVEATKAKKAKRDKENDDVDEEDFLREVEADKEMRLNMNLYKTEVAMKMEDDDDNKSTTPDYEDDQKVRLDELLDGLVLDDGPDKKMKDFEINEDLPWGGIDQHGILEEGEKAAKDGITYAGREESQNIKDKDSAMPVQSFGDQFLDKKFKFT